MENSWTWIFYVFGSFKVFICPFLISINTMTMTNEVHKKTTKLLHHVN